MAALMCRPVRIWLVFGLASGGCGSDLAEIETRQQALRREVDVLSSDVAEMRRKMQEMGILPEGPLGGGPSTPDEAVDLGLTVSQQGDPPALPVLGPVERRAGTPCGYRMRAVALAEISDKRLVDSGSGPVSPVTVSYDGRALESHAGPARFENTCGGAFRLLPRFLFFSPFVADDVDGDWVVGLVREQPVRRDSDGLGLYWVYPGTSITFAFAEPWDDARGDFGVHLDARLLHVGRAPASSARVEVLGEVSEGTGDRLAAPKIASPPDGPWSVTITSPSDGPFVLVESLWVGNEDAGQVVSPAPEAS